MTAFHHLLQKEFILFIIAGGIAACANFFSRILFNFFFSYSTSVILAYIIGMIVAYTLMKLKVFNNRDKNSLKAVGMFVAVNMVALVQTYVIAVGSVYLCDLNGITMWGYHHEICHFLGLAVPVFTSYFGHKYLTFNRHG